MSRREILIVAGAVTIPTTTCIIATGLLIVASDHRDRHFALLNIVSSALLAVALGLLTRVILILRQRRLSEKPYRKVGRY